MARKNPREYVSSTMQRNLAVTLRCKIRQTRNRNETLGQLTHCRQSRAPGGRTPKRGAMAPFARGLASLGGWRRRIRPARGCPNGVITHNRVCIHRTLRKHCASERLLLRTPCSRCTVLGTSTCTPFAIAPSAQVFAKAGSPGRTPE
jgi:hypothetical protein